MLFSKNIYTMSGIILWFSSNVDSMEQQLDIMVLWDQQVL